MSLDSLIGECRRLQADEGAWLDYVSQGPTTSAEARLRTALAKIREGHIRPDDRPHALLFTREGLGPDVVVLSPWEVQDAGLGTLVQHYREVSVLLPEYALRPLSKHACQPAEPRWAGINRWLVTKVRPHEVTFTRHRPGQVAS